MYSPVLFQLMAIAFCLKGHKSPSFDPPGTSQAPLGSSDMMPDLASSTNEAGVALLPNVTMVFCSVDGGKQFVSRHRREGHEVHNILVSMLRSVLQQVWMAGTVWRSSSASRYPEKSHVVTQVDGGYFVRQQDGELKYMVVFHTPEVLLSGFPNLL